MSNWTVVDSLTKKFTDIYGDYDDFKDDYDASVVADAISSDSLEILYYLLYARYANDRITNLDENQFKHKLFSIIWQYGPTWEKRLEIQGNLRDLLNAANEADLLAGAKAIYNHAFNPSTDPSTQSLTELTYINDQNTTNYKKSKMDAYTQLWGLLATDVTESFLDRFSVLFKKFISPKLFIYEEED